ncbi:hypothetical protein [Alkalihalobacillus deserti]|uniref:hypothetical protein n=1 Tax=Alkalihalobacillus deserti TaxID=2879466 RepID=UPI001D14ABC4|nr:hypothetical protein [Alkalihalobacillus deserti]
MLKKRTYESNNLKLKEAIKNSGIEYSEYAAMRLEKINVKSKKKRIRQKALKKALTKEEVAKEILLMVQGDNQKSKPVDKQEQIEEKETLSVRGLPVTFLLKLGKKYLKEEEAVRFYYNADKEEFYKNKKLLENVVENHSVNLTPDVLASFQADVKVELDKRSTK